MKFYSLNSWLDQPAASNTYLSVVQIEASIDCRCQALLSGRGENTQGEGDFGSWISREYYLSYVDYIYLQIL